MRTNLNTTHNSNCYPNGPIEKLLKYYSSASNALLTTQDPEIDITLHSSRHQQLGFPKVYMLITTVLRDARNDKATRLHHFYAVSVDTIS